MTADEAQSILQELTEIEFPKLIGFSIVFALLRNISSQRSRSQLIMEPVEVMHLVLLTLASDVRHSIRFLPSRPDWRAR